MAKRDREEPAEDVVSDALRVLKSDLPEETAEVFDGDLVDDVDAGERDIPDDLTFTTKRKTDEDDAEGDVLEIKLDDAVLYARKPSKGAWSLVLGAVSRSANQADKTQAMLEFVFCSFDQPGQILLKSRMLDPEDEFDIDDLSRIVTRLIEKWAPAQSRADRRAALRSNGRR